MTERSMCFPATPDDDDDDEAIAMVFAGPKERWRATYDALVARLASLGPDVAIAPADGYVSLLRGTRRFGIVQPAGAQRLDIGIKLRGVATSARFEPAGTWSAMVTHRVRIKDANDVDSQVFAWLRWAYAAAAGDTGG
jgi:hypothetical protein